jgi:hypothetical protein
MTCDPNDQEDINAKSQKSHVRGCACLCNPPGDGMMAREGSMNIMAAGTSSFSRSESEDKTKSLASQPTTTNAASAHPVVPMTTTRDVSTSWRNNTNKKRRPPPARIMLPTGRTSTSSSWKNLALFVVSALLAVQLFIFPFTAHHAIIKANEAIRRSNSALWSAELTTVGGPSLSLSSTAAASYDDAARQKKRRGLNDRTADGSFNGGPIYYKTAKLRDMDTKVHCIGETYTANAWKFRSCRFEQYFCYNTTAHDFVIFATPEEQAKATLYAQREFLHVADSMFRLNGTNDVSLGGLNLKWGAENIPRLKWFPRIVQWSEQNADETIAYYELPESTVLLPYHCTWLLLLLLWLLLLLLLVAAIVVACCLLLVACCCCCCMHDCQQRQILPTFTQLNKLLMMKNNTTTTNSLERGQSRPFGMGRLFVALQSAPVVLYRARRTLVVAVALRPTRRGARTVGLVRFATRKDGFVSSHDYQVLAPYGGP